MSTASLEGLPGLTSRDQQETLIDEAIAAAQTHPQKVAVATFLLEHGRADLAAAMIDAHGDEFHGAFYGSLLSPAEALRKDFPASAWILYRSLLLTILEQKRSKAYHRAADYLAIAGDLAERAGLQENHQALLAQLRSQHGRKYGFWGLVKK
ncbi:MAG TPA: hypothetical protein PLQ89_16655 [Phycisphaerae bacterium]|nr:hypothetical protein [Phycisphaerae bacterium]HOM52565.1 hypothetical protein [Phycisphaerae bacterium]HOQ87346.1 hypothetical protein [Phycisphaerae bacterium]HPP27839.1 hypothetical protein [Phycisphaerae bacterium]HPU27545.1 hypothetical protein [Phycisphaerae bacterium]